MLKLKRDDSGAASLLTVIFVAIILTIITVGFIRLAINEQRVSTDDDLTTRAYYAAESGVEDAKRALRAYAAGSLSQAQLNGDVCDPPSGYNTVLSTSSNYDIEYTCQLIDLSPATLEYYFEGANETIQVPIYPKALNGNPPNFNRITIRWHINDNQVNGGDGVVGTDVNNRGTIDDSLKTVDEWNSAKWPAMFRINILRHPKSGNFGRSNLDQFVSYINPLNTSGFNGDGGPANFGTNAVALSNPEISPGACDDSVTTGGYYCEITFTGSIPGSFPASRQHYLRLTSLYRGAHIQVSIAQGGQVRLFDRVQAVADVTGRAGGVFRRVQTTLNLISPSLLPDAAITSLTDICKDFFITDEYVDFVGEAFTSCREP